MYIVASFITTVMKSRVHLILSIVSYRLYKIVLSIYYIGCLMNLKRESAASVWFDTYANINPIYLQKRVWKDFLARKYDEEYYRIIMESSSPFVTPLV